MHDLGHSVSSSRTGSRDLLEVVLDSKKSEIPDPNLSSQLVRNTKDITRPTSLLRRSSDAHFSRQSLASDAPGVCYRKQNNIHDFMHSLRLLFVGSLVLALLALFVLNILINHVQKSSHLTKDEANHKVASTKADHGNSSSLSPVHHDQIWMAGFGLTSLVIASCLCCSLVCSMQCLFTSKILRTPAGEERANKFLRECSSSRVLAQTGFFMCIPTFLVDIGLLLVLLVPPKLALLASIILGLGVLICLLIILQNCYHWQVEKSRADSGLPVYDSYFSYPGNVVSRSSHRKQSELCTLV
ncbi:unnamed protein product [Lymnaea stagnalis]|uniref:Uncharacterized protein n=1 Tax=Lymnaea stagnalis TaxID=6523 RepID=A0AAV2GXB6_LYMST